jgi:D-alanyl-D-alanine carboxypeptidase
MYFFTKRKLFLASALLFSLISITGKVFSFDSTYAARLQSALDYQRTINNFPGLSAAVIVPGQGIWTGTSGISDSTAGALTPEMVFGIGSITKNFTAAAILKLQEEGLLSIDDSLHKYLPRYNNIDTNIKIRELLQHTSGIYNYTDNPAWLNAINSNLDSMWLPENTVANYVLAPYFAHGASWRYSNTNYLLLGLIIKRVTGLPVSSYMRQKFFTPLQFTDIALYPEEPVNGYLVHNWVDLNGDGILDDASFIPTTAIYSSSTADGGLMTSPLTVAKWANILFKGGVLNQQSLQQMTTFRNVSFGSTNGYGLGTMRYNVQGRPIWGHGGNIFGFASIMMYSPSDSIAVAIITNRDISTTVFGLPFMSAVIVNRPVGIEPISNEVPGSFELKQNYPNPFNPETKIDFKIAEEGFVTLKIYDALGKEVRTLVSENLKVGNYSVKWEGKNNYTEIVAGGVYFYKLSTGRYSQAKKMLLLK